MRIYGIDFTSAPRKSKPITCASGEFKKGNKLSINQIEKFPDFSFFEIFLKRKGPWIAGMDFPFGLPLALTSDWKLKSDWKSYISTIQKWDQNTFEAKIKKFKNKRAKGLKEPLRITDSLTGAKSPLKLVNPPVAKMFFQGALRIINKDLSIIPCRIQKSNRVVLEAYPSQLARQFGGPYKNDLKIKQTPKLLKEREKIIKGVLSSYYNSILGFKIHISKKMITPILKDPSGDLLDACLCVVQATWAYSQGKTSFGIPSLNHPTIQSEGWILKPPGLNDSFHL